MSLTPLAANPREWTSSTPASSSRRRTSGFDGRGMISIITDRSAISVSVCDQFGFGIRVLESDNINRRSRWRGNHGLALPALELGLADVDVLHCVASGALHRTQPRRRPR